MKVKSQKSKVKILGNIFSVLFLSFCFCLFASSVHADTVIDNGITFLKSKQDQTGRITTGFSAPSQWSAIALTANGIDITTVKNPTNSLKDFLLSDIPTEPSSATDWETRILAIVAIGGNPTNFGGVNYVSHLETFYNSNQIGDKCSLNDDIFGVLALVAAGTTSNTQIKQDTLNFLISKQDSAPGLTGGGFGFSAPGCAYYSTSADMTGAAIQALVYSKQNGLTNPGLDDAISKAKNYLIANRDSDGGFGYYGSSDTDTTGWVLMAFNSLDLKDSAETIKARKWLLAQQSPTDGGFTAFDYGLNKSVSNSSTTAQAIIGLSGKTWILKIFNPSEVSNSSTPTVTSTPTPTPTTSSNSTSSNPTPTPTFTPVPTASPTSVAVNDLSSDPVSESTSPTPRPEVLGESIEKTKPSIDKKQLLIKNITSGVIPLFLGFGLYVVVRFWERRWKKNV